MHPDELGRLGGALGLPVDPEMVQPKKAPKQDTCLFVSCHDDGTGDRAEVAAQGSCPRSQPGCPPYPCP